MMATISSMVTVDFLGDRSPRTGGLTIVNVTCTEQTQRDCPQQGAVPWANQTNQSLHVSQRVHERATGMMCRQLKCIVS